MASNTKATENRRQHKHRRSGHRRKAVESKHSTPSAVELFAGFGEPGKPAQGD